MCDCCPRREWLEHDERTPSLRRHPKVGYVGVQAARMGEGGVGLLLSRFAPSTPLVTPSAPSRCSEGRVLKMQWALQQACATGGRT